MRKPLEVLTELKQVTLSSKPNIKFHKMMNLINELETTLTETEPKVEDSPIEFTNPTNEDIDMFDKALADFLELEHEDVLNKEESLEELIQELTLNPNPVPTPKSKGRPSSKK
jgi:hypothetical protein